LAKKADKTPGFEQTLNELESIVETMEKGDLALEDALKSFEQGVTLARTCNDILNQAEQRVQLLSGKGTEAQLTGFESDN